MWPFEGSPKCIGDSPWTLSLVKEFGLEKGTNSQYSWKKENGSLKQKYTPLPQHPLLACMVADMINMIIRFTKQKMLDIGIDYQPGHGFTVTLSPTILLWPSYSQNKLFLLQYIAYKVNHWNIVGRFSPKRTNIQSILWTITGC